MDVRPGEHRDTLACPLQPASASRAPRDGRGTGQPPPGELPTQGRHRDPRLHAGGASPRLFSAFRTAARPRLPNEDATWKHDRKLAGQHVCVGVAASALRRRVDTWIATRGSPSSAVWDQPGGGHRLL